MRRMTDHAARLDYYTPIQIAVFSSHLDTRGQVKRALGRLPDDRLGRTAIREFATGAAVLDELRTTAVDLVVLDAESAPEGGIGIAKQLKDELLQCPPIVLAIARPDDGWLARWSGADAVVRRPIDPLQLADVVLPLLRRTLRN